MKHCSRRTTREAVVVPPPRVLVVRRRHRRRSRAPRVEVLAACGRLAARSSVGTARAAHDHRPVRSGAVPASKQHAAAPCDSPTTTDDRVSFASSTARPSSANSCPCNAAGSGRAVRATVAPSVPGEHAEVAREVRDLRLPEPAVEDRPGRREEDRRPGCRRRTGPTRSGRRRAEIPGRVRMPGPGGSRASGGAGTRHTASRLLRRPG